MFWSTTDILWCLALWKQTLTNLKYTLNSLNLLPFSVYLSVFQVLFCRDKQKWSRVHRERLLHNRYDLTGSKGHCTCLFCHLMCKDVCMADFFQYYKVLLTNAKKRFDFSVHGCVCFCQVLQFAMRLCCSTQQEYMRTWGQIDQQDDFWILTSCVSWCNMSHT